MVNSYQQITCNLSTTKKVRRETLHGKSYLVAPAVLLTEDVHAGANKQVEGGIYYPQSELNNMPSRWDHKPIVVNHPKKDGEYTTACNSTVLENSGCGFFLNTNYDDKLRTELWFDEEKTRQIDERIITALEKEEMMELSTGLYMDVEITAGEFNGKKYSGIARNFAPDHVAILPDSKGACSIDQGCGCLQVNESVLLPLVVNEASYDRVSCGLNSALESMLGYYAYVRDVYGDFFIYRDGNGALFKKSYSVDKDGKVTLGEDNTPVKWVTEYRTMGGVFVGNTSIKESPVADKKTYIDVLVANKESGWEEGDRKTLEGFPETKLKTMHDFVAAKITPPAITANTVVAPVVPAVIAPPVIAPPVVETPRQLTVNEYIATAPPALRGPLSRMVANEAAEKSRLIANILANPRNSFRKEYLEAQDDIEIVRAIAGLATAPESHEPHQPSYAGQATMPMTANTRVQEPLGGPVYDFTKK